MINKTERQALHRKFWDGLSLPAIPASFRLGDYFFANKFQAALPLLAKGRRLQPDEIDVEQFLSDYEQMYQDVSQIGQSGFWMAEPFAAIPWLEAILGCPVYGNQDSFVTRPPLAVPDLAQVRSQLSQNQWYLKYMAFVDRLISFSRGRFSVGQPITRGISDMLGALLGQEQLIYAMADYPDQLKIMAGQCTDIFLDLIAAHHQACALQEVEFGLGFYHIWTPEPGIWFQEDLSAILSPPLYHDIIKPCNDRICAAYSYNMLHLHSSSFHLLDDLLTINSLKAVEINKDIGGLSISEMVPVFTKILEHSLRLVIWGALDQDDLKLIRKMLPLRGVFLNIVAGSLDEAKELSTFL